MFRTITTAAATVPKLATPLLDAHNVGDDSDARLAFVVDDVFRIYRQFGSSDYIGEPVSVTEHSILAAMQADADDAADDEVVVAAFLHDIGHLLGPVLELPQMDGWGTTDHDSLGAAWLRQRGFGERVCSLVRNHVQAKRYLVAVDPAYHEVG
jgi:predicted HD phosphohydrolase